MHFAKHSALAILAALSVAGGARAQMLFSDVPMDHWARAAIEWAHQNHIMTGPGGQETTFKPNAFLTRAEQAAVSMRLYEKIQGEMDMLSFRILELEREARAPQPPHASPAPRSTMNDRPVTPPVITPREPVSVTARLYGSQVVPPVTTSARGSATFRMTSKGLWYDISVANLSGPITGAHFHRGDVGVNGPVIESIQFVNGRAQGYWQDISSAEWVAITGGDVYVSVQTGTYPEGEIRGQLQFIR